MDLSWDGTHLRWRDRVAPAATVVGFHERFGRFSGRAWLEVRGPGWRVPIGPGYGPVRVALRGAFPDQPFTSDWMHGRFPSLPGGIAPGLVFASCATAVLIAVAVVGVGVGGGAAALVAAASIWPLGRLRDAVVVGARGVRAGPPWAPRVPWYQIDSAHVRSGPVRSEVWIHTHVGVMGASVPTVLVPALRARMWRLGGLNLVEGGDRVDAKYGAWRAPAAGTPWGLLLGTAFAAPFTPTPWTTLVAGLLATAATALLGAAVEARAGGWGTGAVLGFTAVYAVVLAALAIGMAGWVGAS